MKKRITSLVFLLPAVLFAQSALPVYKDKNAPIEKRIDDLVKRMTLEEKVLQTNQWTYGKNANANNIESQMKVVRPEIGSLIFRSINPVYRNQIQRKAMEESRLGIPILMGFDVTTATALFFLFPLPRPAHGTENWLHRPVQLQLRNQSCRVLTGLSRP